MKINVIALGHIRANCYMVETDSAAVVVDPGNNSQIVTDFFTSCASKARMILLTHAHFDHICGAKKLREETGAPILIGAKDAPALADTRVSLSDEFHAHQEPFAADRLLTDGERFSVGDLSFSAIETPGHTMGGMCYLTGKTLFSGDTLFLESIGRTDFIGSNPADMCDSLRKLMTLPDDITVYPGHGEPTTICHERKYNSFL